MKTDDLIRALARGAGFVRGVFIVVVSLLILRTGWDAWSPEQADQARQRYAFHRFRVERDKRENDERLAAKAAHKLADLENQTLHTDPEVIARKRAVIEAAMARAKARQAAAEGPDGTGSAT